MSDLTAPMVRKNDEQRMTIGPVLVPDEQDSDGDIVTEEKIEEVAHKFLEDYGNIDLQHSLNNVGKVIESYIAPDDINFEDVQVPKGSWMMGVRVTDDDTWEAVKNGTLTGFSIMGIPKASTKSSGVEKNEALKRTTLNDLGVDWTVNAVSLVDEPAVPKAKWVAIKSKSKDNRETITQETISKALEGSLEHRKRLVEDKMDEVFWTMDQIPFVHSTMEDSLIMRIHNEVNGGTRYMQVEYSIDDNGNVEFTGDPQEVQLETQVVPVDDGSSTQVTLSRSENKPSSENERATQAITEAEKAIQEHDKNKSQKTVIEKIADFFGLKEGAEKSGRQISADNFRKLGEVKERVDDIYEKAELERDSGNNEPSLLKEGDDMEKEDVKQIVKEEMNGMQEQLKELVDAYKSEQEDKENDKSDESAEKSEGEESDDEKDQDSVSNEEYEEVVKQLESLKKRRPLSQRISGQDDMEETEAKKEMEPKRDAFGIKKAE